MSTLKVEYAPTVFSKGYHCEDDVPVVRLEALREWLEKRQDEVEPNGLHVCIDSLIDELDELKDKP